MAAERTLLAWIRTGVAMMGFGFVVARFGVYLREMAAAGGAEIPRHGISPYVGTGLLIAGAVCIAIATFDYIQFLRTYEQGIPLRPKPLSIATVLAGLLSIAGVGLAVYLLTV
jgi:putative membrane protein